MEVRITTFDKNSVKEILDDGDIFTLLEHLGAEPQEFSNYFICKTICHGGDSRKLYYYVDNQMFKCYTKCDEAFDIFELVQKVKGIDFNAAISYIVNFFNLQHRLDSTVFDDKLEDWSIFQRYDKLSDLEIVNNKIVLPEIDSSILDNYPQPRYINWEMDGISKEVCDYMNIRYNPLAGGILIPHYDENNRLIGIRERTLVQENEPYGKYRPWKKDKSLFNHPLGFNLYNLGHSKNNIKALGIAIVFESEKSVMAYQSKIGLANDISVAVCGSSLSKYQFQLLLDQGAKEIVIGFDRDYNEIGDEDYKKVINKLQKIYDKYSYLANISFLFDKENILQYKASPIECSKEEFMYLFRNRVII